MFFNFCFHLWRGVCLCGLLISFKFTVFKFTHFNRAPFDVSMVCLVIMVSDSVVGVAYQIYGGVFLGVVVFF